MFLPTYDSYIEYGNKYMFYSKLINNLTYLADKMYMLLAFSSIVILTQLGDIIHSVQVVFHYDSFYI